MNSIGIFIFRKDLRLNDNLGLINLSKKCKIIYCIFILDDYQIEKSSHNKYYYSNNAVQFMCESLEDLNEQLNGKLNLFKGDYIHILDNIIKSIQNSYKNPIIIGYNKDYTQYALLRDSNINKLAKKYDIKGIDDENDITLIQFENMVKGNETAYMI